MESRIYTNDVSDRNTPRIRYIYITSIVSCCCLQLIGMCGCDALQPESDEKSQEQSCAPVSLYVVEDIIWPAGGHELVVRAEDEDGMPWKADEDCLKLKADRDVETLSSSYALEPGVTLLVIQPGNPETWIEYREAIQAFIDSRPEDERLAVYGWGKSLVQASDFTTSRDRLLSQIERLERLTKEESQQDVEDVFAQAIPIVERVEAPHMHGHRSLVFVVSNDLPDTIPHKSQAATVQWVVPDKTANDLAEGHRVLYKGPDKLKDALVNVSDRLDRHAAQAFYRMIVCSDPKKDVSATLSTSSRQPVPVVLNKSLKGEQAGKCDVEQIDASERQDLHTVNLILSEKELSVYQERLKDIDDLIVDYGLPGVSGQIRLITEGFGAAKDPFDLHVTLNSSEEPIKATGHFRGQTAIFCPRKSYTINLAGTDARFFGDHSGSDEFYLISMCRDPGFFFGFLGDSLYSQYDLFPPRVRFVEIMFNGETQGVYLMMEKREEELQRDSARLRGVIRRRYETLVLPEIEYGSQNDEILLTAYNELNSEEIDDDALPAYLRERMDLDQYLRWIGLNSLLVNADTFDECLFVSTETIDANGNPTDYFRLVAWDLEEILGTCDASDPFAGDYGLTYCQEASFERRILSHSGIFRDYVTILKSLLADLTVERFQSVLDRAKAELFPLLEREGVSEAMQLPDFRDEKSLKAMISEQMQEARRKFESRRKELQAAVQAWESAD